MPNFGQFITYYDRMFPLREATFSFLKSFLHEAAATILDIGCGTGSCIGRFGSEGYAAIGTDIDETMIGHARATYKKTRFHTHGMSDIEKINSSFDLIYAVGNVVPHLPAGSMPAFLENIRKMLKVHGVWIFQTVNWERIIRSHVFSLPIIELDHGEITLHRSYTEISDDRVIFNLKLQRNQDILFEDHYPLYPMVASDIIRIHKSPGFKLFGHFGDFLKNEYNPNDSPASIFVFINGFSDPNSGDET